MAFLTSGIGRRMTIRVRCGAKSLRTHPGLVTFAGTVPPEKGYHRPQNAHASPAFHRFFRHPCTLAIG